MKNEKTQRYEAYQRPVITVRCVNKTYKIARLKNAQLDAMDRLLVNRDNKKLMDSFKSNNKLACKAAAVYVLDGYWKLKFRYWFLWRWFYYVRQYDNSQLQGILEAGIKQTPSEEFIVSLDSLLEARDILLKMIFV